MDGSLIVVGVVKGETVCEFSVKADSLYSNNSSNEADVNSTLYSDSTHILNFDNIYLYLELIPLYLYKYLVSFWLRWSFLILSNVIRVLSWCQSECEARHNDLSDDLDNSLSTSCCGIPSVWVLNIFTHLGCLNSLCSHFHVVLDWFSHPRPWSQASITCYLSVALQCRSWLMGMDADPSLSEAWSDLWSENYSKCQVLTAIIKPLDPCEGSLWWNGAGVSF